MTEKEVRNRRRPVTASLPPRIDASPEELARAMFNSPPAEDTFGNDYHCKQCGRQVSYPETLYEDGICQDCHT